MELHEYEYEITSHGKKRVLFFYIGEYGARFAKVDNKETYHCNHETWEACALYPRKVPSALIDDAWSAHLSAIIVSASPRRWDHWTKQWVTTT